MSPNTAFLYFLLLLFSILIVMGVLVPWLARRWYTRRNGHQREKKYANEAHKKMTFAVIIVSIFLSLSANVFDLLPGVMTLILFLGCLVIYITGSTYLWKKESTNKDDYRYELLVNGGAAAGGGLLILVWIVFIF